MYCKLFFAFCPMGAGREAVLDNGKLHKSSRLPPLGAHRRGNANTMAPSIVPAVMENYN